MPDINIKTTHKPIKNYYTELERYAQLGEENEGTVRAAFQSLLQHYCGQSDLTLLCEKSQYTPEKRRITPDGIMQALDPISLERKYTADPPELQCNEVMLLPYYIASMNIEHEFYTATNRYLPYEGICLVDTFEMVEDQQIQLLTPANTTRVEKQKETEHTPRLACRENETLQRQNADRIQRFPNARRYSVKSV